LTDARPTTVCFTPSRATQHHAKEEFTHKHNKEHRIGASLPAPISAFDARHTANDRLLHVRDRIHFQAKDVTDVVFDSADINLPYGLPRARPLNKHFMLAADSATHEYAHHLTERHHIGVNPTALPLHEHFINAGTLAATNYNAVVAFHCTSEPYA
jgi:hypothetical protein